MNTWLNISFCFCIPPIKVTEKYSNCQASWHPDIGEPIPRTCGKKGETFDITICTTKVTPCFVYFFFWICAAFTMSDGISLMLELIIFLGYTLTYRRQLPIQTTDPGTGSVSDVLISCFTSSFILIGDPWSSMIETRDNIYSYKSTHTDKSCRKKSSLL